MLRASMKVRGLWACAHSHCGCTSKTDRAPATEIADRPRRRTVWSASCFLERRRKKDAVGTGGVIQHLGRRHR